MHATITGPYNNGDYRLTTIDKEGLVENIFEGSFRYVVGELLKINPTANLVIRKGKRK